MKMACGKFHHEEIFIVAVFCQYEKWKINLKELLSGEQKKLSICIYSMMILRYLKIIVPTWKDMYG